MDQSSSPQSRERLESRGAETVRLHEQAEKPSAAKEAGKKASDVLGANSVDNAESQDGAEAIDGKISESAGEDKSKYAAGQGKAKRTDDEIEAIRAKLLAAIPPREVMIKQITKKLRQEEKKLTKEFGKLSKTAHKNAFQLNIVVMQLRKVKDYFAILAHATYELIKHLWLKIVHGV
ncbi:MAG: hypothetical protein WCT53_04215 [Candidatus Gracilibacteria bacterium]